MKRLLLLSVFFLAPLAALVLIIPRFISHTEELVFDPPVEVPAAEEEALPVFSLKDDLPGVYVLTALFSDELRLTESELSVLRERGIPLTLTIRDDGAVSLLIFDMQTELRADFDAMFFLADGHPYPFFFQNGSLTVWDSGSRAVFEKII